MQAALLHWVLLEVISKQPPVVFVWQNKVPGAARGVRVVVHKSESLAIVLSLDHPALLVDTNTGATLAEADAASAAPLEGLFIDHPSDGLLWAVSGKKRVNAYGIDDRSGVSMRISSTRSRPAQ